MDQRALTSIENGKKGGRPKGSTNKLKAIDFFTVEEREALVEKVKAMVLMADQPDKDIAKFLWEQIFGKATQPTENKVTFDQKEVKDQAELLKDV